MKRIHENSTLSHEEHESSGKGASYRQRIVNLLTLLGEPMTDRELINALHATDVNNVRPEITRLKQRGVLRECGKVTCSTTGNTVRTVCINN